MLELILAEDYEEMDQEALPSSIVALKKRGAHRCWHKHSTFLKHLLGVHDILRLWGQGPLIGRVGLFHSAYSNSFVNLALFDPKDESERQIVRDLIGFKAEETIHMFCIINRQEVVVETLLKQGYIPKEGLSVPHLRDPSEKVYLSPETLRMLVVFTMADIADQYFGWQDDLFGGGGTKGSMIIPGQDDASRHMPTAIWPGRSRPGLWMSYLSQLGQLARTFNSDWRQDTEEVVLDIPPIFDNCTKILSVDDEAASIDLYWKAASGEVDTEESIDILRTCIEKNPFAFEPRVLLAQHFLHAGNFQDAERMANAALDLRMQWGTTWDKRLSLGGWVAWTRVLLQHTRDKEPWPNNSWAVNSLGLVE